MLKGIFAFLPGYTVWRIPSPCTAAFLELCRSHGLLYDRFRHLPDGGISVRLTLYTAGKLKPLCVEAGIAPVEVARGGLPCLLLRLLRRPGLWVGGILGMILLLSAHSVLWDIRISGNETVSDSAILETLGAVGLTVGTPIRGLRADVTENKALLLDDRLAWISVNRKGTVAYVEVREAVTPPPAQGDEPCNLVAAMGGVIDHVESVSGNVRVAAGQIVGEGDLLISGLYDSATEGIRIVAARGRVFARTTRVFTTRIPLTYTQKTYATAAGDEKTEISMEKSIIFFGRHIKFSKKTGNIDRFCDTIEDEISWGLVDGVGFPISTRTVWYLPYEMTPATRTYAEAEELAYLELARYIASLPGGATLIGKTVTVRHGEDSLTLTCTLTAIEDIATERPIQVAD